MTLIEILLTLSIIILISCIQFPKYNTDLYNFQSISKQLCNDLRYVRKKNILGDSSTYISLETKNKQKMYILKEEGKIKKEVILPKDIKILYLNSIIIFEKNGTINNKGATITIKYKNKKTNEITVTPVSGRIFLKE